MPRNVGDEVHDPAHYGQGVSRGGTVETAADVRRVLAEAIDHLTANPDLDPLQKARVLAELARVVLRAIELGNLAARVEAIEAVLRRRKDRRAQTEQR